MIRNAAKALIVKDNSILLVEGAHKNGERYYTLPGGGQNQYETLTEAVARECMEETGYKVNPLRLAAMYEEIITNEKYRKKYPDYAHKVFFVFLCEVTDEPPIEPTERDTNQIGLSWMPVDQLPGLPFVPVALKEKLVRVLNGEEFSFIGSFAISI